MTITQITFANESLLERVCQVISAVGGFTVMGFVKSNCLEMNEIEIYHKDGLGSAKKIADICLILGIHVSLKIYEE